MKNFKEWQLQQEFAGLGASMQGIDDLQVRAMLKRRLEMLFEELEKMNMPRMKVVEMLSLILREFQQQFSLSNSALRTAARLASAPTQAAV